MAKLNEAEQAFLTARKQEQQTLAASRQAAHDELAPLETEYDALQVEIEALMEQQAVIGRQKREVIERHNLGQLDRQYADVARDVTKLLRKQRDA